MKMNIEMNNEAKCPKCKSKYFHKNIFQVRKCNICGYDRTREENETNQGAVA
jgi:transposase-like protein